MPLVESESLVLKSYNLAEADRIVVFLTREQGIIRGVAKGVKRLKSRFGSSFEPFSVIKLTYLQKESVELASIQNAELIQSYFGSASSPDFLQKFAYLADLLAVFLPPHDPSDAVYRMSLACLKSAALDPTKLNLIGLYFEIWLLKLSGFLPDWKTCHLCRNKFDKVPPLKLLSNFNVICVECSNKVSGTIIEPAVHNLFLSVLRLPPDGFNSFEQKGNGEAVNSLSKIVKKVISQAVGHQVIDEKTFAKI